MDFIFEAGCEAVCPRVQPLLAVGLIDYQGLIDRFFTSGGV
jgi:hypothetical protein